MTFGREWKWGANAEECRKMFDAYAEAGGNVVDTADKYTDGQSETILGELLAGQRDRWVVSTKYTVTRDARDPNASGNHRKNLMKALEASLRRLDTDYVDLYWVHIWDRATPIEETMRALDDAVRAGKVLYVGVSDMPAWTVARANTIAELRGWTPFAGIQVRYNLAQRDIERELLPMADALGLSVAAWSPLAAGLLSGKFNRGEAAKDARLAGREITERESQIAGVVQDVAAELGASPSQVAVAWTRAHRKHIHPLLGARTLEQLADNLAAVELVLPEAALVRLDEASAIDAGFPYDFLDGSTDFVFGEVGRRIDFPAP
jgi:aryl-alcohol dehydrogenase-like predicted oxidoreductase